MQIFSPTGRFIRRINIRFIDIVAGLAITKDNHIAAIDSVTPTVFVIAENGDLVTYFDCKDFMSEPSDIAVFGSDFYICDFKVRDHQRKLSLVLTLLFFRLTVSSSSTSMGGSCAGSGPIM